MATGGLMVYHADGEADRLGCLYRDALIAECRKQKGSSRRELNAYCDSLAAIGFTNPQMHEAVKAIERDVVLVRQADPA